MMGTEDIQSATLSRSYRDGVWLMVGRILFTIALGPLIGTFGVFLVLFLPELIHYRPSWDGFFDTFRLVLLLGWLLGAIPATLGALAMIPFLTRRRGHAAFIALTALVGAIASLVGIFVYSLIADFLPPPGLLLVGVLAGAVSLVVCTLLFDLFMSRRVGAP